MKLLIIIVKQRAALSPILGQFGPNCVNKFFCVLSSFLSLVVFYFWLVFIIVPYTLFFGCLVIPCSTHQVCYWCDFFIEFTTIGAHRGARIKGKSSTMGSKWDIEKFTGDNDFRLWKVKMEVVLIQQKCEKALKGEGSLPVTMSREEKTEMVDKARSAIVLCLRDKVLREVAKEPTATSMWAKLKSLYMTKSLAHRQFSNQQLYSFKMVESKAIMEQLTEFNKIIDDLENIEVQLEDEDKDILLLCALLKSFESFKDTMLYGKEDAFTLE